MTLIKSQHNLISLFNDNNYNSRIIQIDLFLVWFTIHCSKLRNYFLLPPREQNKI